MTKPHLNVLVAYPYMNPQIIEGLTKLGPELRFVLDSGAFTAWKAGKPIKLDDYCRFLEGLPVTPWRYFTLDVIGDPEGTFRNYETMLKRGFKPVPIFTRGEDPSVLNDYYKTSDVVGIGGLVGTPNNKGFVRGIMRHVGKRMTHWLGFANMQFLRYYRPYMCDSSTWESAARYGSITLYMGNGKFKTVSRTDFQTSPEQAVLDRIRLLGLDPHVFARCASWAGGPSPLRALCARNGVSLSVDLESALGTKQFLAITTGLALDLLTQGFVKLYSATKP
jgi:hypothetical protein